MNKILYFTLALLVIGFRAEAQLPFKFAFVSDTHINEENETASEDLQRSINDINAQQDIDFVVITGDITELGTNEEVRRAKTIFDKLRMPYRILPGNHDTGWSESGGVTFAREFGYDKFVLDHKGYRFIGCASGPYVRMADGHIPRESLIWLDSVLAATPKDMPLVFLNHFPLSRGLDNWYEITDRLKKYNTQFVLAGHNHTSSAADFEGIPGTIGRTNLRGKEESGAYNIVTVRADSVIFEDRNPLTKEKKQWRSIALGKRNFEQGNYPRPSYAVNTEYSSAKPDWVHHSSANVVSTPLYAGGLVIFGNSVGTIEALSEKTGKTVWTYQTGGGIYSSAAADGNKMVMGSADGSIYCLEVKTGKLIWQLKTDAAVLGSVSIENHVAYVGGSDRNFRAIDIKTGKELWKFGGLNGWVVSRPLIHQGKVIFGAWDTHLYALDINDGSLAWKWNNGRTVRNLSPAMVNPVAHDGVVYIVAPDRYLTAIDGNTGNTLWRTNEVTVRESLGMSADKKLLYGKTMDDELVAFKTGRQKAEISWRLKCGFGREYVASMPMEDNGTVYFGTKNGVVYAIDPKTPSVKWVHKIDHSMVNTVNAIGKNKVVAATIDGKVVLIRYKE
jgi:outer membrane protein assembly factor BamB